MKNLESRKAGTKARRILDFLLSCFPDYLSAFAWLSLLTLFLHVPLRAERLDFPTHILPVLTKAGCNSGGCHGAATGQGGFKLSLLGYDPEQDHLSLTRELGARRIDLAYPPESLFLKKATRQIEHEGERRFSRDSDEAALLERWVAAGAPFGPKELRVVGLEVEPTAVLSTAPEQAIQLRVTAELSDGTGEDVTALALYSSNDDAVADVTKRGVVQVRGSGSTGIMVRYAGQVAATLVDRPFVSQENRAAFAAFAPQNFIDELVLARLQRLHVPPSTLADDVTFLRRVSLDLAGRLPTPVEITAFLGKPESAEKRRQVIDRLLRSEEFTDLWTMRFADLLLLSGRRGSEAGTTTYHRWLHDQLARNRPWNEIVRALVTAEGSIAEVGPANYLNLANDPRDLAEHVGTMFLGTQIGCARCHAHPSDRWTQGDYHQFAAYFAKVTRDEGTVRESVRGEVEHPKTGRAVLPKPLGSEAERTDSTRSRRAELADWLVAPDNPLFAKSLVNRVWKHLLGRGLVEPVDDLRLTNPASNPALLDALAAHFVASGFDLRDLVRTIAMSRTYQLASQTVPGNERDDRFHSHALLKTPSAQVLLDVIAQATGVPEQFAGQTEPTRAVQLVGVQTPSHALDVLGRCARERSCETVSISGGGLAQALHLINGSTINRRLSQGLLTRIQEEKLPDDAAVRTLYLHTLSRPPTPAEATEWKSLVATSTNRAEALEDLLWALLNSREFVFNH
jgi:hypothetical protein